jgi:hypothetical protein
MSRLSLEFVRHTVADADSYEMCTFVNPPEIPACCVRFDVLEEDSGNTPEFYHGHGDTQFDVALLLN